VWPVDWDSIIDRFCLLWWRIQMTLHHVSGEGEVISKQKCHSTFDCTWVWNNNLNDVFSRKVHLHWLLLTHFHHCLTHPPQYDHHCSLNLLFHFLSTMWNVWSYMITTRHISFYLNAPFQCSRIENSNKPLSLSIANTFHTWKLTLNPSRHFFLEWYFMFKLKGAYYPDEICTFCTLYFQNTK
jgi:hypothetical protein